MVKRARRFGSVRITPPVAGFSLVEIIVVLFVISLALVGILSLIVQNIQSQYYNRDNLIAYQLAQEGVELIRKVRDSNWKASLPARSFKDGLGLGNYYMDYLDSTPHPVIAESEDTYLLKQDANGYYANNRAGYSLVTPFSRKISIMADPGSNGDIFFSVTVAVTWTAHNRNFSYNLETILYDWR